MASSYYWQNTKEHCKQDCCKQNPDEDYAQDNNKTCVELWDDSRIETAADLARAVAESAAAKLNWQNAALWESTLKNYWESLKTTADLTKKVRDELHGFDEQTRRICKNIDLTVKAIELLYLEIDELFSCLAEIKNTSDRLRAEINCIKDSGVNKSVGVVKALADFEVKLAAAFDLYNDALTKLLAALRLAHELEEGVCNNHSGLQQEIEDLSLAFTKSDSEPIPGGVCCDAFAPKPTIPLKHDIYYTTLRNQHDDAEADKNEKKKRFEAARQKRDGLQACLNSLTDALDTAKKTKEGK